jgi:hypothetical protein
MTKIIPILSLSFFLLMSPPKNAQAGEASCVIKDASNQVVFRDKCIFDQFGGNGSFTIKAKSGLIYGRKMITVTIIESEVAQVRGLTTDGINSRWGEARRSKSDKACWVGDDFTICAY